MAWLHFKSVVWNLEVSYDLAPEQTFFFFFFKQRAWKYENLDNFFIQWRFSFLRKFGIKDYKANISIIFAFSSGGVTSESRAYTCILLGLLFLLLFFLLLFGEQWCRGGESNRLPPMWPGFDFQTRRHMWVEFVGSLLCSGRFSPGYSGFFPLLKNLHLIKFDLYEFQFTVSPISVPWR